MRCFVAGMLPAHCPGQCGIGRAAMKAAANRKVSQPYPHQG